MDVQACAKECMSILPEKFRRDFLMGNELHRIIQEHASGKSGFRLKPRIMIERRDDMSPSDKLTILQEDDGDMIVSIFKPDEGMNCVQFCAIGAGGGRSPQTLRALRALAEAIALDNREEPSAKGNLDQSEECFGSPLTPDVAKPDMVKGIKNAIERFECIRLRLQEGCKETDWNPLILEQAIYGEAEARQLLAQVEVIKP